MALLGLKIHKYFSREVQCAVLWLLVMLLKSSPLTKYTPEGYICWVKSKALSYHQATWYSWCPVMFLSHEILYINITLHWDFSKQGPKSLLGHRLTKQTDIASFRRQLRFSTNHLLFKQNWKVAHIETVSNSDYFSSFNFLTTKNNTLAFKTHKILPGTFQIPWIKMKLSIVTSGKLQCRSEFPQNFTIYLCR